LEQTVRQQLSDYIVAHQEEFYRLAYSYVKNRDAALDVVQESIVKALAKSDTLRRPEYLKTWFYRILLNESMNHHRRAKRLVPLEDTLLETPVPARDPGERLDLYDAIERLDWKEQTVVRLRFFEDMKLEEIARVKFGLNRQTYCEWLATRYGMWYSITNRTGTPVCPGQGIYEAGGR